MTDKKDHPKPFRMALLLKAAAERFLDQGYEAVSIDSLIQQVGGSKRNVYDHFKGKDGLFIKIMTDLCDEITAPLESLELSGVEPEVALRTFSEEVLRMALKPRTLALHRLMISEASRFPDLSRAIWRAGHETACKALEKWISDQQRSEKLTSKRSPEFLSAQFISMLIGYAQLKALLNPKDSKLSKKETADFISDTVEGFLFGNSFQRQ
jgi:AcrR family transcriptional regulator